MRAGPSPYGCDNWSHSKSQRRLVEIRLMRPIFLTMSIAATPVPLSEAKAACLSWPGEYASSMSGAP